MSEENKRKVIELLKSIETGDGNALSCIHPGKFIQHNLAIPDGVQGLQMLLKMIPPNTAKAKPVRVFQDGDHVFAHTEFNLFGSKVGFDIYRFENGQIVEHWDNLQDAAPATPSGHTMTDGATEIRDLDKTEANKRLVRAFIEDVLIGSKMDKLTGYFDGGKYIQHNPQIGDGLAGLGQALETLAKMGITMKYDRVHKVLGEGNFVLAVCEGLLGGQPRSFYDLFRVENGKLVEHWDIIEAIPAKSEWKNANGKF